MEDITDEMIINCLQFIQKYGGEVSRYPFDRYITYNIKVEESFNVMPRKLMEEGLISIFKEEGETKIKLTLLGIGKLSKHNS